MSMTTTAYLKNGNHHGQAFLTSATRKHIISGVEITWLIATLAEAFRGVAIQINAQGNWQVEFTDIDGNFHRHELAKVKE
jgi:hypothetical protein